MRTHLHFDFVEHLILEVLYGSISQLWSSRNSALHVLCFLASAQLISVSWLKYIKAGKHLKYAGQCALRTGIGKHWSMASLGRSFSKTTFRLENSCVEESWHLPLDILACESNLLNGDWFLLWTVALTNEPSVKRLSYKVTVLQQWKITDKAVYMGTWFSLGFIKSTTQLQFHIQILFLYSISAQANVDNKNKKV